MLPFPETLKTTYTPYLTCRIALWFPVIYSCGTGINMAPYGIAGVSTLYNEDEEDMPIADGLPINDEPPQTVTVGFMSTVRAPANGLVDSWATLQHIAKLAKLKGDITGRPSMAGSLVRLLTGEDEDATQLEISEAASVSPQVFEKLLAK